MSDRLARLLAHPLRQWVLFEYQHGPACPSEVARRLEQPLNLVSYHTGVLAREGWLRLLRTERRHGATTRFYCSTIDPIIFDDDWVRLPRALRRALTLGTLRGVADEARRAALAGGFDGGHAHVTRWVLELDEEGAQAASQALTSAVEELHAIEAAARSRGAGGRRYEFAMLAFEPERPHATRP